MERPTLRRPTWHRPILTPEGWRKLGAKRSAERPNRMVSVRNKRLPGRSVRYVPLYGHPLRRPFVMLRRVSTKRNRPIPIFDAADQ